ncbi:MAG: hypothetical protein IPL86_13645 [Flavobacteriales bacterium]|nr:hypothetical protein [Flavobacteriales bacterium]
MVLYLTYNDQPSGIYWSQVTDVVAHLNSLGEERVRLLALVSPRSFWKTRKAIKKHAPTVLVLPMVPTMQRWRMNSHILAWACRMLRPSGIMARGPFATWMALRMRDRGLVGKVGFDARGAYGAEWEEYRIVDDDALIAQVRPTEKEALEKSDIRLAVSNALVANWQKQFGYRSLEHVVVPCTLGTAAAQDAGSSLTDREALGLSAEDVVLVYAGSVAGWQSFSLLEEILGAVLMEQPLVKVLFLSRSAFGIDALAAKFPGRVLRRWVDAADVPALLAACDHGLLVREDSITNRVASPTKFAEYLLAGLPVLISPHIGDYGGFVLRECAGTCVGAGTDIPDLHRTDADTRMHMRALALEHFSKAAHEAAYQKLMHVLGTPAA